MELMTEQQVSDMLKISLSKLRNDRSQGKGIPYLKIGVAVRYSQEQVKEYLESQMIQTDKEAHCEAATI